MPNVSLPIRDLHYTVERPIIYSIVRQLMEITQISHETPISFYGIENKNYQQNSTLDKNPLTENRWPYDERITIEIEEDFDRESILATAVQSPEHLFIFRDPALKIYLKPVYAKTKVTINIKYRAKDENQAKMWRNDIRTRISMLRDINLHSVKYHYHFQEEYYFLLQELHRLRETVAGYGEDFNDYFTKHLTTNASLVTNASSDSGAWVIAEHQNRIQGLYDFEGIPEKGNKDNEHDNWTINFAYNFTYEKPIEINMAYPIMVHNQLLDEKYRPTDKVYRLEDYLTTHSASGLAFEQFSSDQKALNIKAFEGINIPHFDEFIPASVLPTTIKIFTALVNIEPSNRCYLFNLKELGDFSLHPEILKFLTESEFPYLGKDFQSIFSLSLYRDNQLQKTGSLMVNANLDVVSPRDLDLRQTYRVRLGLVTNTDYLPIKGLQRVQNYPQAGIRIVDAINAAVKVMSGQPDINKNQLSVEETKLILGKLPADYHRHSQINVIQSMFVATRSMTLFEEDQNQRDYGATR